MKLQNFVCKFIFSERIRLLSLWKNIEIAKQGSSRTKEIKLPNGEIEIKIKCGDCQEYYSKDKYHKSRSSKTGTPGYCKECANKNSKKYKTLKNSSRTKEIKLPNGEIEIKIKCGDCQEYYSKDKYRKARSKTGVYSYCKECTGGKQKEFTSTFTGFVSHLVAHTKINIKQRNRKNRKLEHDITKDYILDLIWKQEGRCSISKCIMTYKTNANSRMSIERLDNNIGYIKDNVCLICIEFNSSDFSKNKDICVTQWTRERYLQVYSINSIFEPLDIKNNDRRTGRIYKNEKIFNEDKTKARCPLCKEWKLSTNFQTTYCKPCTAQYYKERRNGNDSLSFLRTRIVCSKWGSNTRKNKGRILEGSHELSVENLIEKYNNQKGKCFYSGIPLSLACISEWQMSIERINNNKDYTNDNTVLICLEFQNGHSQWSKKMVTKFWGICENL